MGVIPKGLKNFMFQFNILTKFRNNIVNEILHDQALITTRNPTCFKMDNAIYFVFDHEQIKIQFNCKEQVKKIHFPQLRSE